MRTDTPASRAKSPILNMVHPWQRLTRCQGQASRDNAFGGAIRLRSPDWSPDRPPIAAAGTGRQPERPTEARSVRGEPVLEEGCDAVLAVVRRDDGGRLERRLDGVGDRDG